MKITFWKKISVLTVGMLFLSIACASSITASREIAANKDQNNDMLFIGFGYIGCLSIDGKYDFHFGFSKLAN